jgi:hypothetical protein
MKPAPPVRRMVSRVGIIWGKNPFHMVVTVKTKPTDWHGTIEGDTDHS